MGAARRRAYGGEGAARRRQTDFAVATGRGAGRMPVHITLLLYDFGIIRTRGASIRVGSGAAEDNEEMRIREVSC